MKYGNETNDPFFMCFLHSNCNNLLLYLKIVKIHFYFDFLSHDPFWSLKYLNFGQKLPIRTAFHTFLILKLLKIYVRFCLKGSRKKVSAHRLINFLKKLELDKLYSSNYMEDSNWKKMLL